MDPLAAVAEPEIDLENVTVSAGDRTFDLGKPGTPEFDAARLEFIRYQASREGAGLREPTHTRDEYEAASEAFTAVNVETLRAKAAHEQHPTAETEAVLAECRARFAQAKRNMDEAYHGHHGTTAPSDGVI